MPVRDEKAHAVVTEGHGWPWRAGGKQTRLKVKRSPSPTPLKGVWFPRRLFGPLDDEPQTSA